MSYYQFFLRELLSIACEDIIKLAVSCRLNDEQQQRSPGTVRLKRSYFDFLIQMTTQEQAKVFGGVPQSHSMSTLGWCHEFRLHDAIKIRR